MLQESIDNLVAWSGRLNNKNQNLPPNLVDLAAFLFPADAIAWAIRYMKDGKSLCGIASKTLLAGEGCTCPEHGPYEHRDGMAMADLENMARRHKIWTAQQQIKGPYQFGDIVTLGPSSPHALSVVRFDPESMLIYSIDGGQPGYNIKPRIRLVSKDFRTFTDVADGASTAIGRKRSVWGMTRTSQLDLTLNPCKAALWRSLHT